MTEIDKHIHTIIGTPTIIPLLEECGSKKLIDYSTCHQLSGSEIIAIAYISKKCTSKIEKTYNKSFIKTDIICGQVYYVLNRIYEFSSNIDDADNAEDKLLVDLKILYTILSSTDHYAKSVNIDDNASQKSFQYKKFFTDYSAIGLLFSFLFALFSIYILFDGRIDNVEYSTKQLYDSHDEYIAKKTKDILNNESTISKITESICANESFLKKIELLFKRISNNNSIQLTGNIAFMSKNLKGYTINGTIYDPDEPCIALNIEADWGIEKEIIKSWMHKEVFICKSNSDRELISVRVIDFSSNSDTKKTIGVVSMSVFKKLGGTEKVGILYNCRILIPAQPK